MVLRDLTPASCAGGSSSAAAGPLSSLAARIAERAGAPSHAPPPPRDNEDRINALIHGHHGAPPRQPRTAPTTPMYHAQRDAFHMLPRRHTPLIPSRHAPLIPPVPEPDANAATAQFEAAFAAAAPPTPGPSQFRAPRPTPAMGPMPMWRAPHMFPPMPPRYMPPHHYGAPPPLYRPQEPRQPVEAVPNQIPEESQEADSLLADLVRRLNGVGINDAEATANALGTLTEEQQSLDEGFTGLDEFRDIDRSDVENQSTLDTYAEDIILAGLVNPTTQDYVFEQENPYGGTAAADALAEGVRLREEGQLARALLAFEAALNRPAIDPHPPLDDVARLRAWYLLGITLAECDDDVRAIQALSRVMRDYASVAAEGIVHASDNQQHPTAIATAAALALAVSHVDELDVRRAVAELWRWQSLRDGQQTVPTDGGITAVIAALENVERTAPEDLAEVQLALGVAQNANRDYDAAASALRRAVALRENDARLWNRLGATLANGGRSDEALRAYRRAVDLCPLYVRAWVNVGTAYANNNDFPRAARYYLRALAMAADAAGRQPQSNDEMGHVWAYLRSTFLSMGRNELLPHCERTDIEALREHFQF